MSGGCIFFRKPRLACFSGSIDSSPSSDEGEVGDEVGRNMFNSFPPKSKPMNSVLPLKVYLKYFVVWRVSLDSCKIFASGSGFRLRHAAWNAGSDFGLSSWNKVYFLSSSYMA